MDRTILHCDLNNFFASVEMLNNPELRGKAVAVCGDPKTRHGIVLAKSEPAKKCGVKTGMPIWQAKQLCPDIIIVSTHYSDYSKYSHLVRDIYYRFTDRVEAFGIDECWLDVTGSLTLFKMTGEEMADEIRRVIREEIGLTASIGVSWNKTYSKLGSDIKKPDATTVITRENFQSIVFPLPAADMLFIGRKTRVLLEKLNIRTIGQLAQASPDVLAAHLGVNGRNMVKMAGGDETNEVKDFHNIREVKSVGNGTTLPHDLTTQAEVEHVIYLLAEEIAYRMRKIDVKGTTVSLSLRDAELVWSGQQLSISEPTNSARTIYETAVKIFVKHCKPGFSAAQDGHSSASLYPQFSIKPVHSLRVAVSNLTKDTRVQTSFLDMNKEETNDKISATFDIIRKKYGADSIMFGLGAMGEFKLHFEVLDD